MELHYIWIKKFGFLSEAGINLSSRFIFEMIETSVHNDVSHYRLEVKENPEFIPGYFEKENVSNVTAIIGKNGAGKSSILKYIKSNLPEGLEAGLSEDVLCYSLKSDHGELFRVLVPDSIQLEIVDHTSLFEKSRYGTLNSPRLNSHLPAFDYINYSYFLDFNEDMNNWGGLINISTSYLMLVERKRIFEENYSDNARLHLLTQSSDLQNLNLDEVARAIQLFGLEGLKLPFPRPHELTVEININDRIFFENNRQHKDVEGLLDELTRRNMWHHREEGLINNLLFAILVNFLIDNKKYAPNNPADYRLELKENETVEEYILRFFDEMADYEGFYDKIDFSASRYRELSTLVREFYNFFKDLLQEKRITINSDSSEFMLPLNDETEAVFTKLRELYLKVKGIGTFFNFKWRSLSTGEQSYLSFMSRFYQVKYHGHHTLKKDIFILIDEGDACYHPEWQRKFFDHSFNYLCNLFSGHNLQFIYAANTPFISSDLPKTHVLFIEKKDETMSVFHSKENNRDQTFAANIHTLFSNSFYLDGILIGEFAKKRLDRIIKFLKNDNETKPNETYKKIIDIIGEPVLRKKLQDMWAEKFGLDEELLQLHLRIEEINKIKANKKRRPQ